MTGELVDNASASSGFRRFAAAVAITGGTSEIGGEAVLLRPEARFGDFGNRIDRCCGMPDLGALYDEDRRSECEALWT